MMSPNIYGWIKSEESKFDTDEVRIGDNWHWNFKRHVQMIFHLKNSVFFSGENNWLRAFKNIMEPVLNLSYWMEDIELRDVVFYIESARGRVLSFLVKKYHDEVFVKEHNLDTLFDEITEQDVDYGGVLVQKTNSPKPEILELSTIAFCDQTDIIGNPIVFKHYFSPDKLRSMAAFGWGEESNGATISLDELATLAAYEKDPNGTSGQGENKVPGKTVEVYIIKGSLPEHYLLDNDNMQDFYNQVQIRGFYTDSKGKQQGVCLYRKKENESSLKFHTCKKVPGRALGRGVGESLLHPQIWTNFLTIHKMGLIEAASKVALYTDDLNYANRNRIQDMENLEITTIEENKVIRQVPTVGVNNVSMYENSINEWYEQAQLTGSAFDPVLGRQPVSGTTFRGQERVVSQGRGLHDRRRGQRAKFIEEIYRDWIIPYIKKEVLKGRTFLATLTSDELAWVSEQLAENYANNKITDDILDGRMPRDKEELKREYVADFAKSGNKRLLEILKDEFRDVEIRMGINVAGKQKDLAGISDKLLSVFQFIIANPQAYQQAMQNPTLAKAMNDILEYSGLNQADFAAITTLPKMQPATEALIQEEEPVAA